jgi:hypothetical protein
MAIDRYHVVSPRLRGELDLFGEVGFGRRTAVADDEQSLTLKRIAPLWSLLPAPTFSRPKKYR